jgi:hypothetical protein
MLSKITLNDFEVGNMVVFFFFFCALLNVLDKLF